jgi:hypothetical protein
MAKGKKTGGRNFKKGQSGNPAGRPGLPRDLRKISKLTPAIVRAVIAKISMLNKKNILEIIESEETSMIEASIATIYLKAVDQGDYTRMNFLLERSIGKVKEEMDINIAPQITYKTSMTEDGRMIQDILKERALGDGTTETDD